MRRGRRNGSTENSFITPRPLRSGTDFGDTGYRSGEGHLEDKCSRGGNLEVTEPGMGSLTVTGPTGEQDGARGKLGAVATDDLIDLRAGNRGFPDLEFGGVAKVAPGGGSGTERQRSVIIGAPTRGPSSSIRDSEQLVSLKSVGEFPEEGASVRIPERAGGEVEVQIPEGYLENLDDVRTRLDAILGVLSGGGRSSTGGGSGSERHRRDPSS